VLVCVRAPRVRMYMCHVCKKLYCVLEQMWASCVWHAVCVHVCVCVYIIVCVYLRVWVKA